MAKLSQSKQDARSSESRRFSRLQLPAMYTFVRIGLKDQDRYLWTGHVYDISEAGMRFETDDAIEPGTELAIRAVLPGAHHIIFNATGRVVRLHDDRDEQGPVRMGMIFEHFENTADHSRLQTYLATCGLKAA